LLSARLLLPTVVFKAFFASLRASLRRRAALQIEILALRHQLGVLQRSVKRPKLSAADRFLWAWLSRVWADWRSALVMVEPGTRFATAPRREPGFELCSAETRSGV
jgi:hypothetical protein